MNLGPIKITCDIDGRTLLWLLFYWLYIWMIPPAAAVIAWFVSPLRGETLYSRDLQYGAIAFLLGWGATYGFDWLSSKIRGTR